MNVELKSGLVAGVLFTSYPGDLMRVAPSSNVHWFIELCAFLRPSQRYGALTCRLDGVDSLRRGTLELCSLTNVKNDAPRLDPIRGKAVCDLDTLQPSDMN